MSEDEVIEGELIDGEQHSSALAPMLGGALQQIEAAAIDMQITTAKKYPRSMTGFSQKITTLVKSNKELAGKCIYRVPRAGKMIEGPSIRFAELIKQAWTNLRISSGIVEIGDERIVVRATVLDLQTNVGEAIEVPMSIVTREGKRYGPDMIDTIAKAAQAKARRDVVLAIVPRGLWMDALASARQVALGNIKTLDEDRKVALDFVAEKYKVDKKRVFAALGVESEKDMDVEKIYFLRCIIEAIRDGEAKVEECFPKDGGKLKLTGAVAEAAAKAKEEAAADARNMPGADAGETKPAALEEPPAKKKNEK